MDAEVAAPARLGRSRLPDGRWLAWAEWGPPDGPPVLLCPGAGQSRWLGFGPRAVARLGVRLVSVDRPGLGGSDPSPGRTLLDWAVDVGHLAAERGLARPAVVGFSQGAPFALACAAAGVAAAVTVVSGTDELASPALADAVEPEVRRLVELVAADPVAAENSLAGFGDPDVLWEVTLAASAEVDRAVYLRPGFREAWHRALVEGFVQGPAGYARDTVLAFGAWPFDPASITVPVDLWYGRLDTSPSHSPDHGATLAGRIPSARRHLVEEAGGALLWTHSGELLTSLLRAVGA